MPMRRPNLLDAFRRVNDLPAAPPGGSGSVPPRAPGTPATGAAGTPASEPAAPVPPRVPSSARAAPAADRPATSPVPPARIEPPAAGPSRPPRERLLLLALALAVATLVLVGLLRGRGEATDEAVQAAASGAQPAAGAPAPSPAVPPPTAKPAASDVVRTPHDAALYDARNRYTVRLIHYPDGKQGLALATEAYHWLTKFGYPVGSPILLAGGKGIVLCASAKPTQEELVPLRDNLRRLRYPESSKTMPFSSAYIDEIDDVLAR